MRPDARVVVKCRCSDNGATLGRHVFSFVFEEAREREISSAAAVAVWLAAVVRTRAFRRCDRRRRRYQSRMTDSAAEQDGDSE